MTRYVKLTHERADKLGHVRRVEFNAKLFTARAKCLPNLTQRRLYRSGHEPQSERGRETRTIHVPGNDNASEAKRTRRDSRLPFILVRSSGSCLSPLELATRRALRTRLGFSF